MSYLCPYRVVTKSLRFHHHLCIQDANTSWHSSDWGMIEKHQDGTPVETPSTVATKKYKHRTQKDSLTNYKEYHLIWWHSQDVLPCKKKTPSGTSTSDKQTNSLITSKVKIFYPIQLRLLHSPICPWQVSMIATASKIAWGDASEPGQAKHSNTET